MAVFFLDPLTLAIILGLFGYIWSVWRGRFRRWLGAPGRWTIVAWPLPAVLLIAPILAAGLVALVGVTGVETGEGGTAGAASYAVAYLVPMVGLTVWPPRWLLPPWARERLTALPVPGRDTPQGALAAVNGQPGHGSRARWVWNVDSTPGYVWVDDRWLCFRAIPDTDAPANLVATAELDDELVPELRLSADGDLRLEAPKGDWWSRHQIDIDLTDVDRYRVRARRPWRRDGLLTFEVAGRRPVCLWVDDLRALTRLLPPSP